MKQVLGVYCVQNVKFRPETRTLCAYGLEISSCSCTLSPQSRIFLEKLTVAELNNKCPASLWNQVLITMSTSTAISFCLQPAKSSPHVSLRSILIMSIHLHVDLPNSSLPSSFPVKFIHTLLNSSKRAAFPVNFIFLNII
jgi:hypothetical protein